jgi:hypothetical protein
MIWQVVQPGGAPHPYWSRALPTVSVEGALEGAIREADFDRLDDAVLYAYERGATEIRVYGRDLTAGEKRRWYGRQVSHVPPEVYGT